VTLGTERDGWDRERVDAELVYVLEQVRRGDWRPPVELDSEPARRIPTFHVFASVWLAAREHELRAVGAHRPPTTAPRRPARPWLGPEQVLALLDAANKLDAEGARSLPVRRPLLATLAWAGLWVGETCELRWRAVDLAGTTASPTGVIHVEQAKTDAGVRTVDVQPELREELIAWRAATPFNGADELVFPTRTGRATNRHNVRQRVVLHAAELANVRLVEQGRPPLPGGLSPHALRRSFASWLLAEGEDVGYVMAQLGHTDPGMTLWVYAQVVRHGRTSARSRRRLELVDLPRTQAARALTGTEGLEGISQEIAG
jgi:integrase